MDYTYYPDYLEHYGILGMKWGVRRYQNEDGSWTEAGKDRRKSGTYVKSDGSLTKEGIAKYSNSKDMNDRINKKHYKLVTEFNKGKVSKKALKQVGINDAELNYLTDRQTVVKKETNGAKIGSVVGTIAAGSAFLATSAATYGGLPATHLPVLAGMGAGYGAILGTIASSALAYNDINKMQKSEEKFISSMSKSMQEQYINDVQKQYRETNDRMFRQHMRIHQEATDQAIRTAQMHHEIAQMHSQMHMSPGMGMM